MRAVAVNGESVIPFPRHRLETIVTWYFMTQGKKRGPVDVARLKYLVLNGGLLPTDVVWREGLSEWIPATQVEGLFPETAPQPQPDEHFQDESVSQSLSVTESDSAPHGPAVVTTSQVLRFNTSPATGMSRSVRAGIVAGAIVITAIVVYLVAFPDWENANKQQLRSLKSQAQALVSSGKVKEGYFKYEELFRLLGDHKLRDGSLRAEMQAARIAKDRASARIAAMAEQERAMQNRRQHDTRVR